MPDAATPLRVGVLGTGRIGRVHAGIAAAQVPGVELAQVYDQDGRAAAEVADRLGARAAASAEALLSDADVDAVAICTPTPLHAEHVIAAAQAGKAILCEKPVSLDIAEVDRALAAVADAGVPFQVGFNQRFDPGHAAVAAAVADGRVGAPRIIRITSRDPAPPPVEYARGSGGIFLDMTIHDFDMARHLAGSEVKEVYATGAVLVDPAFAEIDDLDTVAVTLVHESGCLTMIDNSREAVYGYDQRVEVLGSVGMAASENQLAHQALVRDAGGVHGATLEFPFIERYAASYAAEWRAFAKAVREGAPPPAGPEDARAPLLIGLAAWRSVREQRAIKVADLEPGGAAASGPTRPADA